MKRLASWLAVLCLWIAAAAVWPGTAGAEVAPGFESVQELSVLQETAPTDEVENAGSALPEGTFDANGICVEPGQSGISVWWQRQKETVFKGLGAGAIGAGLVGLASVGLGLLGLSLGAPVILAAAGVALLAGGIYGATVNPAQFSFWKALGVSFGSGATVLAGVAGWQWAARQPAKSLAGRAVAEIRNVLGIGTKPSRSTVSMIKEVLTGTDARNHAIRTTLPIGSGLSGIISGGTYAATAGDDFTISGLVISALTGSALGAVATVEGIGSAALARAGALTGAVNYAGTAIADHVFHDKELPSAGEFAAGTALSAFTGGVGAWAGGSMPSKAIRKGFIAPAWHYRSSARADARLEVYWNVLRGTGATLGSTWLYQFIDQEIHELGQRVHEVLNPPVCRQQE